MANAASGLLVMMRVQDATPDDAVGVAEVLEELVAANKRTKASDPPFALAHYIRHPNTIRCSLAIDEGGAVLGFQSLKLATASNTYGTPVGWGIIGTHVRPSAARRGIGRLLFTATEEAAREAAISKIEACIGAGNIAGLQFYESMGFRTYREDENGCCKVYDVVMQN